MHRYTHYAQGAVYLVSYVGRVEVLQKGRILYNRLGRSLPSSSSIAL